MSNGNNFNDFPKNQLAKFRTQSNLLTVRANLPERCSISVPAVINNIYRSAVPAQKYLPERHSAAFQYHYTNGHKITVDDQTLQTQALRPITVSITTRKPSYRWQTARRESLPKIAPIRRAYNVVADNTGLSSFV